MHVCTHIIYLSASRSPPGLLGSALLLNIVAGAMFSFCEPFSIFMGILFLQPGAKLRSCCSIIAAIIYYFLFKSFLQNAGPLFAICSCFGTSFGVIFDSMASFLKHFGSIFCIKIETLAPKVPQERPKAPTPAME